MSEEMSIKSDLSESWLEALDLDGLEAELREEDSAFNFSDYEKYANPANASGYFDEDETEIGSSLGSSRFKDEDEDDQLESEFDDEVITDEDIQKNAHRFYPEERTYRSLLLEIFTPEQAIELEKIQRTYSITNNQKIKIYREKLDEWGIVYAPIGGGTNRYAFMVDGYIVKIACDGDGKIDNKREFIYSIPLQPYVIKCYETYADGLMSIFEYVEAFTIDDFWKNQGKMKEILSEIGNQFLIGDVGITSTNYVNWGFRDDGSIVILDYAYIYSVAFKQFTCPCSPSSMLYYDKDFNKLVCNCCGKIYTFREVRKRISRKDQDEEIGDLYKKGYILTDKEQVKEFNPNFVLGAYGTIKEKLHKEMKKSGKMFFKSVLSKSQNSSEEKIPDHVDDLDALFATGCFDNALDQFKKR